MIKLIGFLATLLLATQVMAAPVQIGTDAMCKRFTGYWNGSLHVSNEDNEIALSITSAFPQVDNTNAMMSFTIKNDSMKGEEPTYETVNLMGHCEKGDLTLTAIVAGKNLTFKGMIINNHMELYSKFDDERFDLDLSRAD